MTDTVVAALIGVGVVVIVAVASAVTQVFITRTVIRAEVEKMTKQLFGEVSARRHEWRHDRLWEAIADLVAASDPQVAPGGDYGRVVQLIPRIQLLLNLNDTAESRLNRALNALGLKLQAYVAVKDVEIDEKLSETSTLLNAQSEVIESARVVLARGTT